MIRNAADLEELIQNYLDNINSADETIFPQVQEYFEQGGAASDLVKVLESKMNCPVCMDIPTEGCQMTNCKHVFCLNCLKLWLLNKESCPLCRSPANDFIRSLTSTDAVVNKIMYTHDPDHWEKRIEEENVKMYSYIKKFCAERTSKQMEQLRVWEQMFPPNDNMVDNAEGVFNIRESILELIEDYDRYLKMLPMTDENEQELVSSGIELNNRYCDIAVLTGL